MRWPIAVAVFAPIALLVLLIVFAALVNKGVLA